MTIIRLMRDVAVALACAGMLLPTHLLAEEVQRPDSPAASPMVSSSEIPIVHDVRLTPEGSLRGAVLDSAGRPMAGVSVVLRQFNREAAATQTDKAGQFVAPGLRGGVYQVETAGSAEICRLWTAATAPPIAGDRLLLVPEEMAVRGQRPIQALFCDPVIFGAVLLGAIAIPIAVHNARNDNGSGS